jgi:hypothetical protein
LERAVVSRGPFRVCVFWWPALAAGEAGLVGEDHQLDPVAAGLSNAEVASRLRISPATAKTHVAHLLTKLDARDRVQLVIIAYQAGLTGC